MSPEIAIQACYENLLVVMVGGVGAELQKVWQELRLIDCDDTDAAVLAPQGILQLC